MAAVQPNQGMPQQGNSGNAMGQQSLLPPGMTKEHVQQLFKVYPIAETRRIAIVGCILTN
jgi:hypothetical protein